MRRDGLASRLLDNESGASFVEFTVIFPLLFMVTFGLVDLGLLMFSWADANRAVQAGARYAATNDPVAAGIQGAVQGADTSVKSGTFCVDEDGYTKCQLRPTYECKGSEGTCKVVSGTGPDLPFRTAPNIFEGILGSMNIFSRSLNNAQVIVTYTPVEQGYVGQPTTPMNVTVTLNCVGSLSISRVPS